MPMEVGELRVLQKSDSDCLGQVLQEIRPGLPASFGFPSPGYRSDQSPGPPSLSGLWRLAS